MKFYGWVPTVTGHLSFSILGSGSFPSKCIRSDFADGFAVFQKRDLLDVLLPYSDQSSVVAFLRERISNWTLRLSGQFSFVLIGDPPNPVADGCSGTVLMIADKQGKQSLKNIKSRLRSVENNPLTKAELKEMANADCCCEARFSLERQGKLTLSVPSQGDEFELIDQILADQIFFFIKDISHVHQHHDPKHDAITEMTAEVDGDDTWIDQTSYSLYRSIIRYKRFRSEKALFRASGVLAYTKSFQSNYPSTSGGKEFSHEELEQSLAVSREELQHFDQKRLASIETFRNFFFALFGLAVSVTFLARLSGPLDVDVDPRIVEFAQLLAQYPLHAVAATLMVSTVWMVLTHQLDPAENEFVVFATRLFQGLRQRYFVIFNVFITGVLCTIGYWLLIGFSTN